MRRSLAALGAVLLCLLKAAPYRQPDGTPSGVSDAPAEAGRYRRGHIFFVLSGASSYSTWLREAASRFPLSALHAAAVAPARTPYRFTIALAICFAQLSTRVLPGKELPSFSAGQTTAYIFYLRDKLGYLETNVPFWTLCQEVQLYRVLRALAGSVAQRSGPANAGAGNGTDVCRDSTDQAALAHQDFEAGAVAPYRYGRLFTRLKCSTGRGVIPRLAPCYLVYEGILFAGLAPATPNDNDAAIVTHLILCHFIYRIRGP
jgi:hypothetical protein